MNKTTLLLGLGLVVIVVLAGVFVFVKKPQTSSVAPVQNEEQKGSMFTSIKDALSKALSLECMYTDEKGDATKTYIKGGSVHVSLTLKNPTPDGYSETLLKDKKMYMWNPTTKKGMVYTLPEKMMANLTPQPTSVSAMPKERETDENKGDSFLSQVEKYKDACKPATLADSLFTIPTDVTFQDMSKLMEDATKMMPTGQALPSGYNIDELKKKYMPQ